MYVEEFRRLNDQQIKNIYYAYANIIERLDMNQEIRDSVTGILFENGNNVFTLKIYRPKRIRDPRLTYYPIEIMKIGKDRKTTIPIKVENFKIDDFIFNVLDSNIIDIYVFDSNVNNDIVINSNES